MPARIAIISLLLSALTWAPTALTQPPPNIVGNGNFDTDLTGWNRIDPASQGLTGTLSVTHDPTDDAAGLSTSGSMIVEWNLQDPTGTTLEATLVSSDCLPGVVPGADHRGPWVHYMDAPLTDGAIITFRTFEGTACLPGPPNGLGRIFLPEASSWFGLDGIFDTSPTEASLVIQFDAVFVPDGGGATVSSGRLHLDRISAFEEAQFVTLTAFPDLVSANGLTLELAANWSGGTSPYPPAVNWDFGDGMVGSGEVVLHAYPAPGSYIVTMTLNNGFQTLTSTLPVTVFAEVSDIPTLSSFSLLLLVVILAGLAMWSVGRQRNVAG